MQCEPAHKQSTEGKSEREVKPIISCVPFPVDFSTTVVNPVHVQFVGNLLISFSTSKRKQINLIFRY